MLGVIISPVGQQDRQSGLSQGEVTGLHVHRQTRPPRRRSRNRKAQGPREGAGPQPGVSVLNTCEEPGLERASRCVTQHPRPQQPSPPVRGLQGPAGGLTGRKAPGPAAPLLSTELSRQVCGPGTGVAGLSTECPRASGTLRPEGRPLGPPARGFGAHAPAEFVCPRVPHAAPSSVLLQLPLTFHSALGVSYGIRIVNDGAAGAGVRRGSRDGEGLGSPLVPP